LIYALVVTSYHDVAWSDLFFGACYSFSDSHRLLLGGAADAFPELGALRRRRYRGQRPCGRYEEQGSHRGGVLLAQSAAVLSLRLSMACCSKLCSLAGFADCS